MVTETKIYRVSFPDPPIEGNPKREFYFSTMEAIYELFTAQQIGCRRRWLSRLGLSKGGVYQSKTCRVTLETLYRKAQSNPNPNYTRRAPRKPETADENEL